MVASQGLTPGLPQPFRYLEVQADPTYTSREYVNIYPQSPAGIQRMYRSRAIIGDYESIPYDTPFDPEYIAARQRKLALYGLGLMGVASIFIF